MPQMFLASMGPRNAALPSDALPACAKIHSVRCVKKEERGKKIQGILVVKKVKPVYCAIIYKQMTGNKFLLNSLYARKLFAEMDGKNHQVCTWPIKKETGRFYTYF